MEDEDPADDDEKSDSLILKCLIKNIGRKEKILNYFGKSDTKEDNYKLKLYHSKYITIMYKLFSGCERSS
jgi:hypothetical protein